MRDMERWEAQRRAEIASTYFGSLIGGIALVAIMLGILVLGGLTCVLFGFDPNAR